MKISKLLGPLYLRRAELLRGRRRLGFTLGQEQIDGILYRSGTYDSLTLTIVWWFGLTTLIWRLK